MKSVRMFSGNESNYDSLVKYIIIDNLIELHNFIPDIENFNEDLELINKTDFNSKRVLAKNLFKSFLFSVFSAEIIDSFLVMDFDGIPRNNAVLGATILGTILFQRMYNKEIDGKLEKYDENYFDVFEDAVMNLETDFNILVDNFIEYAKITNSSDFDIECEVRKIFNEGRDYLKHKKEKSFVETEFDSSVACNDIDYICGIDVFNDCINNIVNYPKVRTR